MMAAPYVPDYQPPRQATDTELLQALRLELAEHHRKVNDRMVWLGARIDRLEGRLADRVNEWLNAALDLDDRTATDTDAPGVDWREVDARVLRYAINDAIEAWMPDQIDEVNLHDPERAKML